MKIEKRKVTEAKPLSVAAKSAMGVMLGMTTAATFIACGGPVGEISDAIDENSSSSEEIQAPKSDSSSPESSNQAEVQQSSSDQTETKQSSSSQVVVDIPLSHEPISSSVMDAISSALESSSSAAAPASATDSTTSSSADTASSAANPESSSEAAQPESSSETVKPASSSSSEPSIREIQDACQGQPAGTSVDIGGQLYICPDTGGGMMFSMISTFERTDAEV